jgi:hypothetical protein
MEYEMCHTKFFLIFALILWSPLSNAKAQTEPESAPVNQQRRYELRPCESSQCAKYPLPLKITEVRNLQNKYWWRDLEVKVRNISDKPVYFITLVVSLPDSRSPDGAPYGTSVEYGRFDLLNILQQATVEDVPLKPGESYIFKIPEKFWPTFDGRPAEESQRVELWIYHISFGDGTGLTSGGVPIPNRRVANPLPYYRIVM